MVCMRYAHIVSIFSYVNIESKVINNDNKDPRRYTRMRWSSTRIGLLSNAMKTDGTICKEEVTEIC